MSVRAFAGGAILLGLFAIGVAWSAARDDSDVPEESPRAPPGCPGLRDPPQPPFPPAHFADRERSFRSIVIGRFGDRERSGATPVSLWL